MQPGLGPSRAALQNLTEPPPCPACGAARRNKRRPISCAAQSWRRVLLQQVDDPLARWLYQRLLHHEMVAQLSHHSLDEVDVQQGLQFGICGRQEWRVAESVEVAFQERHAYPKPPAVRPQIGRASCRE